MTKFKYIYVTVDSGLNVNYGSEIAIKSDEEKELIVTAESSERRVIEYQWYTYDVLEQNYSKIEGATTDKLTIKGLTDREYDKCIVTDGIVNREVYYTVTLKGDTGIPGDVNGDEEVNIKDSALIKRYLAGADVELDLASADVNVDGEVTIKDSALIKRQLAGWE